MSSNRDDRYIFECLARSLYFPILSFTLALTVLPILSYALATRV